MDTTLESRFPMGVLPALFGSKGQLGVGYNKGDLIIGFVTFYQAL